MLPLALILQSQGCTIAGSDRAYDQKKSPEKFKAISKLGIKLYPQDGSGLTEKTNRLVVSGAIEQSVPDVAAAITRAIPINTRAEVLSEMFNAAPCGISIAGTSGKSTVTGMTATIFDHAGKDPTVMNGAVIENFRANSASPFPNMRIGKSGIFITETDESDGSIALYNPAIAVVNNIALDHMPLDDLKTIFAAFLSRAYQAAIINNDDPYLRAIKPKIKSPLITYGIDQPADLTATHIKTAANGVKFTVNGHAATINVAGHHNVYNALAALAIAKAANIDLHIAIEGLKRFTGIARRLQTMGEQKGITVIDDFAHNPDKIAASLRTLKEFSGRVIVMFQPHGFAPLRLMGEEIIHAFKEHLGAQDILLMPEVYYAGGTTDRSITAKDIISRATEEKINAHWMENRAICKSYILDNAKSGDRIVIMGARDDSLTDFAKEILAALSPE